MARSHLAKSIYTTMALIRNQFLNHQRKIS